jgi:ubiquinone/menaquinone biosynthesis C-methylase UbiE
LPFDDNSFDAILCIDSMNHFPDRLKVFQEWRSGRNYGVSDQ